MSYENYHEAMMAAKGNLKAAEQNVHAHDSRSESLIQIADGWMRLAHLELLASEKPLRMDAFRFVPASDPGVVGKRCDECRHFEDNHSPLGGCRECSCMAVQVA